MNHNPVNNYWTDCRLFPNQPSNSGREEAMAYSILKRLFITGHSSWGYQKEKHTITWMVRFLSPLSVKPLIFLLFPESFIQSLKHYRVEELAPCTVGLEMACLSLPNRFLLYKSPKTSEPTVRVSKNLHKKLRWIFNGRSIGKDHHFISLTCLFQQVKS